jgi:hypothetical protein
MPDLIVRDKYGRTWRRGIVGGRRVWVEVSCG